MLTTENLEAGYRNDDWEGFGYLGERRNQIAEGRSTKQADEKALAEANRLGLTEQELFDWANSKNGRWYGDCMFGNFGRHADAYLPGKAQR